MVRVVQPNVRAAESGGVDAEALAELRSQWLSLCTPGPFEDEKNPSQFASELLVSQATENRRLHRRLERTERELRVARAEAAADAAETRALRVERAANASAAADAIDAAVALGEEVHALRGLERASAEKCARLDIQVAQARKGHFVGEAEQTASLELARAQANLAEERLKNLSAPQPSFASNHMRSMDKLGNRSRHTSNSNLHMAREASPGQISSPPHTIDSFAHSSERTGNTPVVQRAAHGQVASFPHSTNSFAHSVEQIGNTPVIERAAPGQVSSFPPTINSFAHSSEPPGMPSSVWTSHVPSSPITSNEYHGNSSQSPSRARSPQPQFLGGYTEHGVTSQHHIQGSSHSGHAGSATAQMSNMVRTPPSPRQTSRSNAHQAYPTALPIKRKPYPTADQQVALHKEPSIFPMQHGRQDLPLVQPLQPVERSLLNVPPPSTPPSVPLALRPETMSSVSRSRSDIRMVDENEPTHMGEILEELENHPGHSPFDKIRLAAEGAIHGERQRLSDLFRENTDSIMVGRATAAAAHAAAVQAERNDLRKKLVGFEAQMDKRYQDAMQNALVDIRRIQRIVTDVDHVEAVAQYSIVGPQAKSESVRSPKVGQHAGIPKPGDVVSTSDMPIAGPIADLDRALQKFNSVQRNRMTGKSQQVMSNLNEKHALQPAQMRRLFSYFAGSDGYLNPQDFERLCHGLQCTENSPAPMKGFVMFAFETVFGVDCSREAIDCNTFQQYFNYYYLHRQELEQAYVESVGFEHEEDRAEEVKLQFKSLHTRPPKMDQSRHESSEDFFANFAPGRDPDHPMDHHVQQQVLTPQKQQSNHKAAKPKQGGEMREKEQAMREKEQAILKIQSFQRGKVGRQIVQKKKQEVIEKELKKKEVEMKRQQREAERYAKKAAATKIQSLFRGKKAKNEFQMKKAEQEKHRREVRLRQEQRQQRQEEKLFARQQLAAAKKIQSVARGKIAKKEVHFKKEQLLREKEREQAVMKIQSLSRGRHARKSVTRMKHENIQKIRENEATMKIQALQRGKMARREVEHARQQQREQREQQEAATRIQSLFRGKTARKRTGRLARIDDTLNALDDLDIDDYSHAEGVYEGYLENGEAYFDNDEMYDEYGQYLGENADDQEFAADWYDPDAEYNPAADYVADYDEYGEYAQYDAYGRYIEPTDMDAYVGDEQVGYEYDEYGQIVGYDEYGEIVDENDEQEEHWEEAGTESQVTFSLEDSIKVYEQQDEYGQEEDVETWQQAYGDEDGWQGEEEHWEEHWEEDWDAGWDEGEEEEWAEDWEGDY
eukprot:gnl/MRDRNA2_/MRDRNA2_29293_c0_seq1.p1 gnl/MRDRNA2_/MRDRNA2_29293_c0~~gnl/MRDRNA2_/MRDRNA2_29293_c0_seq1.p1  ORF type:complete len:1288 (-),score=292.07 gnl/MRDRNA2_/MRDRNA2_29293_c0_seq1:60-3923(-)